MMAGAWPKRIRGEPFERWLLKTFINFELLANFNTHIPPELVEIAFGRRPFRPKSGLFYVLNEKNAVIGEDGISFMRLHYPSKNGAVPRAIFILSGFELLLVFGSVLNGNEPTRFQRNDGTVEESRLMHHPARFSFHAGNALIIDWRKASTRRLRKEKLDNIHTRLSPGGAQDSSAGDPQAQLREA